MVKVNVLKAGCGDSIHIQYTHEGVNKNILIDTGTSAMFSSGDDGRLRKLIKDLQSKGENIDLLIITHWDDDHIGGVLKWFEKDLECAKLMIKHIWFNSGTLINKYFNSIAASEDKTKIYCCDSNTRTSTKQGVSFEKIILENRISHNLIKTDSSSCEINFLDGAKFTILSPTNIQLSKLCQEWKKYINKKTSSTSSDYSKTFEELLSNQFVEYTAVHNGSSIAFILEIEDKNMLFLGDSHPSVIVSRLQELGYSIRNKLKIDLMKISHHGSKANTSDDLLSMIECNKFIISTHENTIHRLPNKETIARIVKHNENCKIYFNYNTLINKMLRNELSGGHFSAFDTSELEL
ncbi:MAG TPA: MBL fold metallo-hydrolase [Burkholderiales bacterium]|nr:MBL fold metallo-hydrolase [Burkholderiales bacterium]